MSTKKRGGDAAAAAEPFYGEFSPCGQFRYLLVHIWDASKPVLPWILFNPSQAGRVTEQGVVKSDPTARKGRGFSERMGYGGMVFCNAFAYIATEPADLRKGGYQVGPDNDSKILQACAMGTGDVMVARGLWAVDSPALRRSAGWCVRQGIARWRWGAPMTVCRFTPFALRMQPP